MEFLEALKVIFLGIVEGITEWLPISSTGHMLLVDEFLHLDITEAFKDMFFVVIQLGAILAVVVMFWKKLFPFGLNEKTKKVCVKKDIFTVWFKVLVACIPTVVIALPFEKFDLEQYIDNPVVIALMLIIYGVAFIIIERRNKLITPKKDSILTMSYKTAFFIGMFQVLSIVPGTSRSGATIIGALLLGVSRVTSAEFTFFLAIPTMVGASGFKMLSYVKDNGFSFSSNETITLVLGTAVAFIVSIFVIKFLMGYIKSHDFQAFGWYRIILGIIVLAYFGIRLFV